MRMLLIFLYTICGAALFAFLFLKFLRKGASDTRRNKFEQFFLHGLDVRKKIRTDPSYLVHFVALMIGLVAFGASVEWLFHRLAESYK
jgi:O-antigen ligase